MAILKIVLASSRLLLFALITSLFLLLLLFTNLFYANKDKKIDRGIFYRRKTIRILHFILGSKITIYGKEPIISGLFISNHRSYFDAVVVLKNILAFPIGKKEVASWPLIGNVAKATGVIFVSRENKESRQQTLNEATVVLEKGFSIFNTPEGTTHINPTTINFKPGAFILAAQLKIPIIPIAIDYKNIDDAWVGNDTFIPHFLKCFGKWKTEIKVTYFNPIYSENAEELISISKTQIDNELLRFRKDWNSHP